VQQKSGFDLNLLSFSSQIHANTVLQILRKFNLFGNSYHNLTTTITKDCILSVSSGMSNLMMTECEVLDNIRKPHLIGSLYFVVYKIIY